MREDDILVVIFKELLEVDAYNVAVCGWTSLETTNGTKSQDTIINKARI